MAPSEPQPRLSPAALEVLRAIWALRRYETSQTPHAIKKILQTLTVADYTAVVLALADHIELVFDADDKLIGHIHEGNFIPKSDGAR
jgi:hypothetical protein